MCAERGLFSFFLSLYRELLEPELSTELDGQIFTLSLSRVFYSSDAARTKYLTRYLASFSISTELALSNSVESSGYLSSLFSHSTGSVLCGDPALRFCSGNLGIKVDSVLVAMCVKNEYID